jgi:hypothetical protein
MGFPQWVSRFKEPHTEIKFINGRYYKYQISHQYDPARKRTVKKSGCLLGKITEDGGFIPSAKNALRLEAEAPPKVDIKTFGIHALFENLLKDEIPSLEKVFGKEMTEQLLAFAMFRWAYNSPIKRALNYHSHDFCSEYWSRGIQLSDKQITALLKYIGENRETVVKWMKELLPSASAASENFIMMDSTHAMSASDNLAINVKGYNPAHDFGKQVRLMYLFSAEMKRPVY